MFAMFTLLVPGTDAGVEYRDFAIWCLLGVTVRLDTLLMLAFFLTRSLPTFPVMGYYMLVLRRLSRRGETGPARDTGAGRNCGSDQRC